MASAREAVFDAVRRIPHGRVLAYGDVAEMVTSVSVTAFQVGQILATCPADVPWQRVVGRDGTLLIAKRSPAMAAEQRRLLEAEGVTFDAAGRVRMDLHQWHMAGSLFDEE